MKSIRLTGTGAALCRSTSSVLACTVMQKANRSELKRPQVNGDRKTLMLNTFGARLSLPESEGMLGAAEFGSSVGFSALLKSKRNTRLGL